MEVNIMNSINLENIRNDDSQTTRRLYSNSDLELDYSNIKNNEEEKKQRIDNNNNQENNINNSNNIYEVNNINERNIAESNIEEVRNNTIGEIVNGIEESNNDSNISNENNNVSNTDSLFIIEIHTINNDNNNNNNSSINDDNNNNNQGNLYKDLIKDLKNNNFIFIKDYYSQKIDQNNKAYISWLKKLYKKLNFSEDGYLTMKNHININQKFEAPEYPILKLEIEKNLFFCENPKCNAIVYMNNEQKKKLKGIEDLVYIENFERIKNFKKNRCPICLSYKCIFCNQTSTLLNSNCCDMQLNSSVFDFNFYICDYYIIFKFALFTPVIRVFYMASMINFALFRGMTFKSKLTQSKEEITRMISENYTSDIIFGTYQAKFSRIVRFIISLLNILGSICWALPYIIYYELYLIIIMFLYFFNLWNHYKTLMNYFYLLAFIPGLRRGIIGRIYHNQNNHFIDSFSENTEVAI